MKEVTVLIPTWRPDRTLRELLVRLSRQKLLPQRVLLLNTLDEGAAGEEEEEKIAALIAEFRDAFPVFSVFHVDRKDFDHGGTRRIGFGFARTEPVLCMTQDALPRDSRLTEHLAAAFDDPLVAAAYGRQLAGKNSSPIERCTREFNYPDRPQVKSEEDLEKLGIKTYFCSDVCAMWRRDAWQELGGFEERTIFNEDMILAGKLVQAGWRIAYVPEAAVWHSHDYSGLKQLRRNFDLGVSQADHPEIFAGVSSPGEGVRYVKDTARRLVRSGNAAYLPKLVFQSGCKFLGYSLGKRYRSLPDGMVRKLTDNPVYWDH